MTGAAPNTAIAMAEHWDQRADRFDGAASHLRHRPAWRNLFRQALGPGPGMAVDLGCGTGACAILLAELGYRVVGVDGSAGMLEYARRAALDGGHHIEFVNVGMDRFGLADRAADAVTLRNVLWTLEDPAAALRIARGLLAPGGRLLVSDGIWRDGENDSEALIGQHLSCFNGVNEEQVRDWFTQTGLEKARSWHHLFHENPYGAMYDCQDGAELIKFFVLTATAV